MVLVDLKEALSEYMNNTTLHGMNYIREKDKPKLLRFFWCIGVVSLFIYLIISMYWVYEEYKQYNFTTKTEVKFLSKMDFPAITICNMELFDNKKLKEAEESDIVKYISSFLKGGYASTQFDSVVVSVDDIKNLTADLDDTIIQAILYGNGSTDIKDSFSIQFESSLRLCLTLNGQNFQDIFRSLNGDKKSYIHLTIAVNQINNVTKSNGAEMEIFVHPSEEIIFHHISNPVSWITPGYYYNIQISHKQYQYLSAPYNSYENSDCVQKSERLNRLKYFPRYSQSACLLECLTDLVLEQCGCVVEFIVYSQPQYKFCNVSQRYCATNLMYSMDNNCSCPVTCHQTIFETKIHGRLAPGMSQYTQNSFIYLKISFGSSRVEEIIHEPKLTITGTFSVLGGYMGFFLGASVLTLFEMVYLIFRSLFAMVSSYFTTKMKHNKTSVSSIEVNVHPRSDIQSNRK